MKTQSLKTAVLQSFRTNDVPGWIVTCMMSVRSWAEGQGWEYVYLDDAFFALAPDWTRSICRGNVYAVTDIARLIWAKRMLEEGYDRVVWVDADVLVFSPDELTLRLASVGGHGFARELFLHVNNSGRATPIHGLNNALMLFESGDTMLDAYLAACYAHLRDLQHGPVPRPALGPALLKHLATTRSLQAIEGVGLFSLAIMKHIAIGGSALTQEYLRHSVTSPVAANLCHFMRNQTPPHRRLAFDRLYDNAIASLLGTGGGVLAGSRSQVVI